MTRVISFPLTYRINKVSQKVSIKKTALYLFKKRRKKREERRAKRVSSMTIHARSQIVERNDDQDSTQTTTRWRFRRERERERERGWHRAAQKRFVFNTTTSRKVKVKMHKRVSRSSNCHTKKASSSQKETCPKTLSLLDPQQQQRSSRRRFFASSNSPLPGRRSISTTRSPGR